MLEDLPSHHRPRVRAVAELTYEPLLARAEELARRWAIALIEVRPLSELDGVPLDVLAREAPAVCAQVLLAVQSDAALRRLSGEEGQGARGEPGLAKRIPAIAGARGAADVVHAVEALRGVLWEALREHPPQPAARLMADLGDRLAFVCAEALAAAVQAADPSADTEGAARGHGRGQAPEAGTGGFARVGLAGRRAVIVDERTGALASEGEPAEAEIEIRDERREEGPAAWISSIGAQLERFRRERVPFAVLLVELVDLESTRRDQPPSELGVLAELMEQACADVLASSSGSLTRERPGRCWLLVPDVDRTRASELAERLSVAISVRLSGSVVPPLVAIGTAVCPDDGLEAAALAAHADVGLYAARSAARASSGRPPTAGGQTS